MHYVIFKTNQRYLANFLQNRKLIVSISIVYFAVLIYLMFFAFFRSGTTTEVNLIPFKTILSLTVYTFSSGHGIWHWIVNVLGNILAFIPMALPLHYFLRSKLNTSFFVLIIILIPVLAEILQYLFQTGSCDVDDVILNVVGIFLGISLLK